MEREDQYREALRVVLAAYSKNFDIAFSVINAVGSNIPIRRCNCGRSYISVEQKCPHCYAYPLFE